MMEWFEHAKAVKVASEVALGFVALRVAGIVKVAIMGWSQLFQLPWMHVILLKACQRTSIFCLLFFKFRFFQKVAKEKTMPEISLEKDTVDIARLNS